MTEAKKKHEAVEDKADVKPAGLLRAVHFWKLIGPMILRYKSARTLPKGEIREAEMEKLHAEYAPKVLKAMLDLGGLYVKLGQAVSIAPMSPLRYRETLAVLQNGVTPKSSAEVHRIIELGLGRPTSQLFRSFDEKPLGAASVGQVHRAQLRDGRQVVVKIQYPEVKASFVDDLWQLRRAARLWSPELLGEVRELCTHFMNELSFDREAAMMAAIADNVDASGFGGRVAVPRPIEGMVSPSVLVMTYLPGATLLEGAKAMARAHADVLGVSVDTLRDAIRKHHPTARAAAAGS